MRGKLLEFVFQQDITRDILAVNRAVTYESYNTRLGKFVAYPRSYDKRYILPGDVLIYRRSDVHNCPRVRTLSRQYAPIDVGGAEGSDEESESEGDESDEGDEGPLPSLITHCASATRYRGSSAGTESVAVTPRRSLRLRQSSASTRGTPRRAVSAARSAPSTPQGGKRKRAGAGNPLPRKRGRTSVSHMVLGRDGAIWEVVDEEIAIKMSG